MMKTFTKKKIIIIISSVLILIVIIGLSIWKYLEYKETKRIEEELKTKKQIALSILDEGLSVYYDELLKSQTENPKYFEAMAKAESYTEVQSKWTAIESSELQSLEFIINDFKDINRKCNYTDCSQVQEITDSFKKISRILDTKQKYLEAWQNGEAEKGNELSSTVNELMTSLNDDITKLDKKYGQTLTNLKNFDSDELFTNKINKYLEIRSYCPEIKGIFYKYARYENTCTTSDTDSYIKLNPIETYQQTEPIIFNGKVSKNTKKIIVTAIGTNIDDEYTLQNYKPGNSTFEYKASIAPGFDNLSYGNNTYYFVAIFDDNTTAVKELTINYYPTINFY